jgi:RNA polymerase sigma factor (sigma-70 family)
MLPSDHELLTRYANESSNEAFTELVRRHLDLVYTAARRQVSSNGLAEEVTQSVFLDLAKAAPRLNRQTPVVAWLHLVARRTAIDLVRRESRLKVRQQIAAELAAATHPSSSEWSQLAPLLDEALDTLSEADRGALLMRYFENKSLREVGQALGVSDDAAQKRVSRALFRLKEFFGKRGVAVGATGLLTNLSTYAVQSAPATLSSALASLSLTALPPAALVSSVQTLTMTALQKTALTIVALVAIAGGAYQSYRLSLESAGNASLEHQIADLSAKQAGLLRAQAGTARSLAEVEKQIDAALALTDDMKSGDAATAAKMRAWLNRTDQLKQLAKERTDLAIPEFALLSPERWLLSAQDVKLDSENDIRVALASLRHESENQAVNILENALSAYLRANQNRLPSDPAQLAPYTHPMLGPGILNRYEMTAQGDLDHASSRYLIGSKAPVDVERDTYWMIVAHGTIAGSALAKDVESAQKRYAEANSNQPAADAAALIPYLKWPLEAGVLSNYLSHSTAGRSSP